MGLHIVAGWMILFILFVMMINLIESGKKRNKTWPKVVGRLCVIAEIVVILIDSGVFLRTGVHSNRLRVIYGGTGSLGSFALYEVKPHGIIEEIKEIQHDNFLSLDIKFGWDFKAVRSGECHLLVSTYDGGNLSDVYDYTVVIDDKLHIQYEIKKVDREDYEEEE